MDLLTLVATCGLAARAALFVPLSGAPVCASAAPALHGGGHEAVAVWQPDIAAAAHRFDIPEAWIAAVMRAESGGQATVDGEPIRSPAGAMGLMQVMPQTYAALRARYGLGADPRSPRDNILAGAAYLREMLGRYGVPWFLAAYNAGPARLDAFLRTGRALPAETQRYLAALAPQIGGTSGALQAAVGTTGLSTKPASEATVPGPKDAIGAGLFATVVVHPEASPTRTVPPIVGPNMAPMPAPTEVTGGSAAAGLEPRSVSGSAHDVRGNGALFVALQ
ncbi:MAG: lytic transglycosylase domain-containing protein [Proteobacteria bacterium]|nr:lytic transglycosylase domain-containing protein [Pseudomonadota bacterium]